MIGIHNQRVDEITDGRRGAISSKASRMPFYKLLIGILLIFMSAASSFAEQGDAEAQYNLALMYSNGEGVNKDNSEAEYWYRKAVEQGIVPQKD